VQCSEAVTQIPKASIAYPLRLKSDNLLRLAMVRSWEREYIGDAHLNLLKNIQRSLDKSAQPYSNSSAIIQSSGYGKSRTVDQLATLVPTIPINVRPVQETTTAGKHVP